MQNACKVHSARNESTPQSMGGDLLLLPWQLGQNPSLPSRRLLSRTELGRASLALRDAALQFPALGGGRAVQCKMLRDSRDGRRREKSAWIKRTASCSLCLQGGLVAVQELQSPTGVAK